MENRIFKYEMTIKEFHLDTFGHVNNAAYLQIYEEARWEFITHNGYGLDKIKETGLGPVILEINLRFIRELHLRKKITIHSQTTEYNSRIGTIKQWITNSEGKICSDTEMKIGLFDTHRRKLVQPTKEWLDAIK
ncbi:thioesterase family protein [Flavobacterium sp. MDT1-60]|uniref:acyl-CoA thioesterase n=1 Tax=Flavobacterium sp. MDT1-60 TaxID=1979344 RepID=UPI0017815F1A|nr:acyl-CoA thioesterase [Flavobacterium sp. MDT1-60]QOG02105.1 acyl-CoA thioesterase [Flavobacterium sp. MDT1-60]